MNELDAAIKRASYGRTFSVERLVNRVKELRKHLQAARLAAKGPEEPAIISPPPVQPYVIYRETPTSSDIIKTVAHFYQKSIIEIKSSRRTLDLTLPRHVCYYLMRELTFMSCTQIAQALRRYDHTTALHGANKIAKLQEADPQLRADLDMLRTRIAELLCARNTGIVKVCNGEEKQT